MRSPAGQVLHYDLMQLAVIYQSARCIRTLATELDDYQRKRLLNEDSYSTMVKAVHLASFFGHYETIKALMYDFRADFSYKIQNRISCMHIAALDKAGIVAALLLHLNGHDVNTRDSFG